MQQSRVTVDVGALDRNLKKVVREVGGEKGPAIMAVVKADAYGHGIEVMAERAVTAGIPWFAVAYMHEALRVRAVAPEADILVLGPIEATDVPTALAKNITPIVVDPSHARALGEAAGPHRLPVHIKVDSGMGRLGVKPEDLTTLLDQPGLEIRGLCSHFASVQARHIELAESQVAVFQDCAERAQKHLGHTLLRHISSSRAMQLYREWDLDIVRPGIVLYGYGSAEAGMRIRTEPCLEWRSGILQVKEVPEDTPIGYFASYRTMSRTDIATVACGYADGYLRSLSNRGFALVGGLRVPVVGRISMNWITLELGPDSGACTGDEVVLLGRQEDDALWASQLSKWAGTIAYEILTAISPNIERQYRRTPKTIHV